MCLMDRPVRIGKYLAQRALGAGSFATVWLVYDELLDAQVAVKVLADNWARNHDVRRRFIDEAKILRRIDHERIVRVHEVDELPDGRPYFVMTWADRGTLHERLRDASTGMLMAPQNAVQLAIEVCECLAVVHDFGAVHRDVKPSNVLFRSVRSHERAAAFRRGSGMGDEQVVLGDFGLAKDMAAASGFTQAAGTPAYMAPEQANPIAMIDRRVDIFGAGSLLYEMLTGQPAVVASTLSGVRRDQDGSSVRPIRSVRPDLPPALAAVVGKALAYEPSHRFASAPEFAAALEGTLAQLITGSPTRSARPMPAGPAGRVGDIVNSARRSIDSSAMAAIEDRLTSAISVVELQDALDDSDVARADVLVVRWALIDQDTATLRQRLRSTIAGPVSVVAVLPEGAIRPAFATDVTDDTEAGRRFLSDLIATVSDRLSVIRASAALAELEQADALAPDITDAIETLRMELPALDEINALRDDAAGRTSLPGPLRAELRQLLLWPSPARRLGRDYDLREAAQEALERWRTMSNTGRIPFTSRATAELIERSLKRLWMELG